MSVLLKTKLEKRQARHRRVRSLVKGQEARLRLSVSRSLQHVYAQLINDETGVTVAAVHDHEIKGEKLTKTARAEAVGKLLAEKAKAKGATKVVFDRGGFRYHGRVKAVAEGARAGGLQF